MSPDMGSSRADFPRGGEVALWDSTRATPALPGDTWVFVGHHRSTPKHGEPVWEATVAEHLNADKPVEAGTGRENFVARRGTPRSLCPTARRTPHALQVNSRGGARPGPQADGRHLDVPMNRF